MKNAYKKTFHAMIILFAFVFVAPSFTSDINAAARKREASSEATAVFTEFADTIDGISAAMTSILGRAIFFLVMGGCLLAGIATKLPKKPIVISGGSAIALQSLAEIEQLFWG